MGDWYERWNVKREEKKRKEKAAWHSLHVGRETLFFCLFQRDVRSAGNKPMFTRIPSTIDIRGDGKASLQIRVRDPVRKRK